ncbi:hypothetical protein [Microbacterium sp. GXF7504]
MSEHLRSTSPGDTGGAGTVDTAKEEAKNLTSTAASEAGSVVETAKQEAASVAHTAGSQVKDLYHQTTRELNEQAGTQQKRLAEGLRSVGDDLGSMAARSEQPGIASDLVRQVSQRVGSAASWLSDRDPGAVIDEVKRFARRKPGTFIAAAAVAGVVVGRLTRALASAASDGTGTGAGSTGTASAPGVRDAGHEAGLPPAPPVPVVPPTPETFGAPAVAPDAAPADTPLYRDLSGEEGTALGEGDGRV